MRSALSTMNRCADANTDQLAGRIARFHGIKQEQVLPGCGSTEILRAATGAFLGAAARNCCKHHLLLKQSNAMPG
jgi:histidinol-phosphate/aromatic aminotransferase/cobyric acid decarboxylase-like protein